MVSVNKDIPFTRASALQNSSINASPAPELVFSNLMVPRAFFSGGVFFSDTGTSGRFHSRRSSLETNQVIFTT